MHALLTWFRQRRFSPSAARIVYLERRLQQSKDLLVHQHTLVQAQRRAIRELRANLALAQLDADCWRQAARPPSRPTLRLVPPQLPDFLP